MRRMGECTAMFDADLWQKHFLQAIAPMATHAPEGLRFKPGHAARMQIFRDNLLFGLCDALAETYEVTSHLLGPSFNAAARDYVIRHPMTCADRNLYGEDFAEFLVKVSELTHLEGLPDMARLEWALHMAHGADDHPVLGFDDLLRDEIVAGHPSARLVSAQYDAFALHEAYHAHRLAEVKTKIRACTYLIWRTPDNEVVCKTLQGPQIAFVEALLSGGRSPRHQCPVSSLSRSQR